MQEHAPALSPLGRASAAFVAAVAFSSLLLQYVLLIAATRDTIGALAGTLQFFGYFTILTNLSIVLVAATAAMGVGGFFARPRVRAAVALYIAVTGLIYVLILRHLWQPQGAAWVADTGLHYVMPVLYLAWWALALPHGQLQFRDLFKWLLFPLVYLGWALLVGAVIGLYPYPFIDLAALGWARTLANAVGVMFLFLVLAGVILALDGLLGRWHKGR
jgi:hypothetical protein